MFKCSHVIVSIFVHEVIEVCYLLYKDFYDGKVISNVNRTSTNFYPSRDQTFFPISEFFMKYCEIPSENAGPVSQGFHMVFT